MNSIIYFIIALVFDAINFLSTPFWEGGAFYSKGQALSFYISGVICSVFFFLSLFSFMGVFK